MCPDGWYVPGYKQNVMKTGPTLLGVLIFNPPYAYGVYALKNDVGKFSYNLIPCAEIVMLSSVWVSSWTLTSKSTCLMRYAIPSEMSAGGAGKTALAVTAPAATATVTVNVCDFTPETTKI